MDSFQIIVNITLDIRAAVYTPTNSHNRCLRLQYLLQYYISTNYFLYCFVEMQRREEKANYKV